MQKCGLLSENASREREVEIPAGWSATLPQSDNVRVPSEQFQEVLRNKKSGTRVLSAGANLQPGGCLK
jgi:hypothetical protein